VDRGGGREGDTEAGKMAFVTSVGVRTDRLAGRQCGRRVQRSTVSMKQSGWLTVPDDDDATALSAPKTAPPEFAGSITTPDDRSVKGYERVISEVDMVEVDEVMNPIGNIFSSDPYTKRSGRRNDPGKEKLPDPNEDTSIGSLSYYMQKAAKASEKEVEITPPVSKAEPKAAKQTKTPNVKKQPSQSESESESESESKSQSQVQSQGQGQGQSQQKDDDGEYQMSAFQSYVQEQLKKQKEQKKSKSKSKSKSKKSSSSTIKTETGAEITQAPKTSQPAQLTQQKAEAQQPASAAANEGNSFKKPPFNGFRSVEYWNQK